MRKYLRPDTTSPASSLRGWKSFVTWCVRILVGAVFIFSGIVKGIDPWGTIYKMSDYLAVMDITSIGETMVVVGTFFLFSLEFLIGIFLVTGSFRRSAPVLVMLFMVVMLPLTFWIAIKNPVPDCGCFGDALVISNISTLIKNLFLTAGGIWLLIYNRRVHWLITPALQWICFVATALYIIFIGLLGYAVQPVVDFREYKIGGPLMTADNTENIRYTLIYEKNGERHEFADTDSLPDEHDGWKFVDRKEIPSSAPAPETRNLRVWSEDGSEDVTDDVMSGKGERQLVLMIPDIKDVSIASTWKINSLKQWADSKGIDFIAVTSGTQKQIDEWRDMSMAEYPVYTAEDTSIKEVARGNPAVVYSESGNIVWKSTLRALRGEDYMDDDQATETPADLYADVVPLVKNVSVAYLCILCVLIMFSFIPDAFRGGYNMLRHPLSRRRRRSLSEAEEKTVISDDGMAHLEE